MSMEMRTSCRRRAAIHGRSIFARGSNWGSPDIFPGRAGADTYRPLLALARDAHFNLLRCWGGAPAPKESFFERCDVLGLFVWQEFPLACNRYPDTPGYLADLDRESRAIIRRVRQHPCLALWCGGNELFNAWSGMDDQSLALRLLNRRGARHGWRRIYPAPLRRRPSGMGVQLPPEPEVGARAEGRDASDEHLTRLPYFLRVARGLRPVAALKAAEKCWLDA